MQFYAHSMSNANFWQRPETIFHCHIQRYLLVGLETENDLEDEQVKTASVLSLFSSSSVVTEPDSRLKGRGFESLQERRENFLLQGQLSVLTLFSVSVPPPCYRSST